MLTCANRLVMCSWTLFVLTDAEEEEEEPQRSGVRGKEKRGCESGKGKEGHCIRYRGKREGGKEKGEERNQKGKLK